MKGLSEKPFRNPINYWLAQCTEWFAPILRWIRRRLARCAPQAPNTWRRALLIGADHIGDILYRTVGLEELARTFPNCEFLFAASEPAADLLEGNSFVSLLKTTKSMERRSLLELARDIRRSHVDAVICYDSGAYAKIVVAAALAGVPDCVAYVHKGLSGFVTQPVPIHWPQPFAAYFRDMVEHITGGKIVSLRPHVALSEEERNRASEICASYGPAPLVVASITSRQPNHSSIQRRMIEALVELKRRMNVTVAILGAAEDEATARHLAAEGGLDCKFATGVMTVRQSVAFFELAALAFCLDSGPRHMANAAGITVVFVRNMEFFKEEAGCYLPTEIDVAPDVDLISYANIATPPLFAVEVVVEQMLRSLAKVDL